MFYDILERQNAFLGYKNKKVKTSKKVRFFQTGKPMVSVKNGCFLFFFFFFQAILVGQEQVFYDILERKNAFLGY